MDNSRSMAENGCAGAACEATVLLARALTRLEVGSLGIVRFGGGSPPGELHPLGMPFTEAQGPSVLAGLRFDQVIAGPPSGIQLIASDIWPCGALAGTRCVGGRSKGMADLQLSIGEPSC